MSAHKPKAISLAVDTRPSLCVVVAVGVRDGHNETSAAIQRLNG